MQTSRIRRSRYPRHCCPITFLPSDYLGSNRFYAPFTSMHGRLPSFPSFHRFTNKNRHVSQFVGWIETSSSFTWGLGSKLRANERNKNCIDNLTGIVYKSIPPSRNPTQNFPLGSRFAPMRLASPEMRIPEGRLEMRTWGWATGFTNIGLRGVAKDMW